MSFLHYFIECTAASQSYYNTISFGDNYTIIIDRLNILRSYPKCNTRVTCIIDIILLKTNEEFMCTRKEKKKESYARENVSVNLFFLERFSATLGLSAHINCRLLLFPLECRWEYSVTNEKDM